MKWSTLHIPTLRQPPNDAEVPSHKLLVQAGYIRPLAAGIYSILPLAQRALLKIEAIIREEMEAIGGQEFELPALLPSEPWKKSGRWELMGANMFRLKDRKQGDFCLGMTHEEIFAVLAASDIRSYKELPQIWYQIQTKFRDEPRPKSGLLRVRQFTMKDSYSLDVDMAGLDKSFLLHRQAYERIYSRCGLPYSIVDADTGSMGGSASNEFMVETEAGEDWLAKCLKCDYAANVEKARSVPHPTVFGSVKTLEEFPTPGIKTIEALAKFPGGAPAAGQIKTLVMQARNAKGDEGVALVLLRGDHTLSEVKLMNALKATEVRQAPEDIIVKLLGAHPGSLGAVKWSNSKILVLADEALRGAEGMVTGANKDGVHYRGVSVARDIVNVQWSDLRVVAAGEKCPHCDGTLKLVKCLEVGHIFKLGTKYSEAMDALVLDREGKRVPIVMGSYGIGVGRILAAAIECHHDQFGMKLPPSIAPYDVVICPLGEPNTPMAQEAEKLREALTKSGLDVLVDDRDERPGVKFKDADLIGIPIRVVIGERSLQEKKIEVMCRWNGEKLIFAADQALASILALRQKIMPQAKGG